MFSRNAYCDFFNKSVLAHKVECGFKITDFLNVGRVEVVAFAPAECYFASAERACVYGEICIFVIAVVNENISGVVAEFCKRRAKVIHCLEVVKVVMVDVQNN